MSDRNADTPPADLVQVGRIVGAYGVRGWVKLEAFAQPGSVLEEADDFWVDEHRSVATAQTGLAPDSKTLRRLDVIQIRAQGELLVAQLKGLVDRDAAQALKAARIWVSRASFPPAPQGEYYWVDLIGCAVVNGQGDPLGQITALEDHGADPIMRVEDVAAGAGNRPVIRLIPFVQAYVDAVDLTQKRVTVDWQAQWDID